MMSRRDDGHLMASVGVVWLWWCDDMCGVNMILRCRVWCDDGMVWEHEAMWQCENTIVMMHAVMARSIMWMMSGGLWLWWYDDADDADDVKACVVIGADMIIPSSSSSSSYHHHCDHYHHHHHYHHCHYHHHHHNHIIIIIIIRVRMWCVMCDIVSNGVWHNIPLMVWCDVTGWDGIEWWCDVICDVCHDVWCPMCHARGGVLMSDGVMSWINMTRWDVMTWWDVLRWDEIRLTSLK